jgi:hypothetical protein
MSRQASEKENNKMIRTRNIAAAVVAASLLAGCAQKVKVAFVGDAENILFTSTGTLLVTGGESVYRIQKHTAANGSVSYQALSVYAGEKCSFTGLAQRGDWVFAACGKPYLKWKGFTFKLGVDTRLFAANVNNPDGIHFVRIDQQDDNDPLDHLIVPNGLAFTPNGELLIADENFIGQGNVGKITLDYSDTYPRIAQFDQDWLGLSYGVSSPNGVRVADNKLYLSDGNKIRRFFFDASGEIPPTFFDAAGNEVSNLPDDNQIYSGGLIIDDIMPYCGGVALTHYLEGQLVYLSANGDIYRTAPLSFESPSALAIGQGPDFNGQDLLVTEKGILMDNVSQIGNQLSLVKMDFDLNDPVTCEAIREL